MKRKITIEEALNIIFDNDYSNNDILKHKKIHDEINKFHPCKTYCCLENDRYEYTEHFLINDICHIKIRYDEYRKKYYISLAENFKNVCNHTLHQILDNIYQKPNNIGGLNKKKINDWIEYYQKCYKDLVELNNEKSNNITEFLESIKNENVTWFLKDEISNKYRGAIVKNGIEFSFQIDDGVIYQDIKIHYNVNKNFESFKKLSNNKYEI